MLDSHSCAIFPRLFGFPQIMHGAGVGTQPECLRVLAAADGCLLVRVADGTSNLRNEHRTLEKLMGRCFGALGLSLAGERAVEPGTSFSVLAPGAHLPLLRSGLAKLQEGSKCRLAPAFSLPCLHASGFRVPALLRFFVFLATTKPPQPTTWHEGPNSYSHSRSVAEDAIAATLSSCPSTHWQTWLMPSSVD